ncbi:mitotic spindle assembly checkpoint protein MAD1 isoform X3 [Podarcis raffonei]|uniref:mitotic spindle assembly checkpoint protein MAD1 isoform X3 n=1 Tax=Podarcis raffonei TaxID=65483 RepID=UPI0023294493|nr:mitotic spindle assembly checkpoint protein MAD1 isoform X3 [Podarcis raffonei]
MAGWGEGGPVHMDEEEGNTVVFSILRSFNNYMSHTVEDTSELATTQVPQGSLQMQYEQMMKREDQAGQIRSEAQFLQMEREKMQMELSHKRARIELEKEANANARNFEREADHNKELLKRIKQCQERETETENKLQEQIEINKSCQKHTESLNRKLQEKENKLAEANETISVLKGKISELQWNLTNQEMKMKTCESQKQELTEQLDVLQKKWREASQQIQSLHAKEALIAEKEQKVQDLEQKLSLQEQDALIVKNMKMELAQFPKMERELRELREENAYLREIKENNGLLKEEVEGLQRKLVRYEKVQAEMVALELEKERLQGKLNTWEKLDQSTGLDINARLLEKARKQLQDELLKTQSQLLEEKKKREQHESMARCLQKRVQLLIKARDGMRGILDSYDSELNPSEHTPQLNFRVREAEDMVQKMQAHCGEMEVQLSQTLEEAGNQKQRADLLEAELQVLKSQTGAHHQSVFITREEVNALRLKIEELETERSQLKGENRNLEMKMEQITLQGYHDPSKTKVLHFSLNPASLAKQQRLEEQTHLREECQRLRELVRVLEAGDSIPEKLEGAASLQSAQEIAELKKQMESAELKNQRLKEVFRAKIQEFRKVCYKLTGYQIDMTTENQYRLTSVYAERGEDCLIFKASRAPHAKMQLLETEFSRTVQELIDLHLLQQDSIPAFLSAVTLDLFSRQTVA